MTTVGRTGGGGSRYWASRLTLKQQLRLVPALTSAMVASQAAAVEHFESVAIKKGSLERHDLIDLILMTAKAGSQAYRQALGKSWEARELLMAEFEDYMGEMARSNELAVKLIYVRQHSPLLLSPFTRGRSCIPAREINTILDQAVAELAAKLGICPADQEKLKESLLPGLTDPHRLALY